MDAKTYYRRKREKLFRKGKIPRGIRIRRLLHPLIISCLPLARKLSKQKLAVIHDGRIPGNGPFVYACSHIGWDDIQMTFEAIHDHAWLFWGDPEYFTPHYYALMANGAVCLDSSHKTDRGITKDTAVRLLQKGESLLIYPEGAWNVMENLPVMKLFPGAAEMAIQTGAEIIPIGIAMNGLNDFCVSIGKNIQTKGYRPEDKWKLTELLRDRMATEVWRTWEHFPRIRRADLPDNPKQWFEDFLTSQMHGIYTVDDFHRDRYHDRRVTEPEEVFFWL